MAVFIEEVSEEYAELDKKEIDDTTKETKSIIEKIVNGELSAAQLKNVPLQSCDSMFIKYKPSQQSAAFNSGAEERIIRMVQMPIDALEPSKFKHKPVPKASGSPPVPVIHSPPRPVTIKDQQDWKIPPCISNWKNLKGYTIPLDKRLASDGRGLQEVQINDNFAKLSETLYVAEQKAREAVTMRSELQKEMLMKEEERKEQELRALAQKARSERIGLAHANAASLPSENSAMDTADMSGDCKRVRAKDKDFPNETREVKEELLQRERIREVRRRKRERERLLMAKDSVKGKIRKITRDRDRDISEEVALGMASSRAGKSGEVMYDQRLFNQVMYDSGLATDDQYNVYDKGLYIAQPTLSTLCRPKKNVDTDMYGGADEQLDKILKTNRFRPDKGFTGASERKDEADPFGLDQFLTEVKEAKKKFMEKAGTRGTMLAIEGASM